MTMMRAVMTKNKNNKSQCPVEPIMRITRARAKSLGLPPLHPLSKPEEKALRTKRAASDSDARPEKRIVLKDVTNVTRYNPSKDQDKEEGSLKKKGKVGPSCKMSPVLGNKRETKTNDMNTVKLYEVQEIGTAKNFTASMNTNFKDERLLQKEESMDDVIDVDSKHKDPLMCSLYAADIYYNMHTTQLSRRPLVDYIDKVQQDITQDMRAVLIDWLIEVSDEFRMVPDTLYLTVNLVDRFLSHIYIEKQKLQLLGITCMLIASKYEEICAPRVEDLCFVTDNTYTKEEVVQMESCVLNFVGFQLSVPTTKKFIRRFIQASHVSCKAPCAELEFLANYLAELTLTEYGFLKFLPSQIAASAVFLARWTLDQSQHPWNPTLEHYTMHKSPELKAAVLELQELQLNTRARVAVSTVVREKYKQSKFKCVSTLNSSKPVQSLF